MVARGTPWSHRHNHEQANTWAHKGRALGQRVLAWVQEFVQLLCAALPESSGRLQEVTPHFAEYTLPDAFSAQHAALQYIAALSAS